jgi:hypothetical protein
VSEADQANGYGLSAGLAQVGFDVLITVGSGGLSSVLAKGGKVARTASGALVLIDASNTTVGIIRGAEDMAQNGLTRANVIQVVGGSLGLAASPVPKAAAGAAWDAARGVGKGKVASGGGIFDDFLSSFGERLVGPRGPRNAPQGSGTVWDSIKPTQPVYEGTVIPKSFELKTANGTIWVHGNATEHLAEYAMANLNRGVSTGLVNAGTQAQLTSLQAAVEQATAKGIQYGKLLNVGGWELKFAPPRQAGQLPALIHALLR